MTITPAPRRAVIAQPAPRFHPHALTLDVDTDTFRSPAARGHDSLAARRNRPTAVPMPTAAPPHAHPAGSITAPAAAVRPVDTTVLAAYAVEADLTDNGWTVIDQGTRPVATPTGDALDQMVTVLGRISRRSVPTRVSASIQGVDGQSLTAWTEVPAYTTPDTTWNGYTE